MALKYPKQYPGFSMLLVWGGMLYGTEEWSCSLRLADVDQSEGRDGGTDVPAGIVTALQNWMGHSMAGISPHATLTWAKYNEIDSTGAYYSTTLTRRHDWASPIAGAGTGAPPPQVALAVTLETDAKRGLASKGRFYVPLPTVACDATGRVPSTQAVNYANAAAQLVNAINQDRAAVGSQHRVVVASGGPVRDGVTVGPGAFRYVRAVSCGRVLDTQRRRRSDLVEERQAAATAVTP